MESSFQNDAVLMALLDGNFFPKNTILAKATESETKIPYLTRIPITFCETSALKQYNVFGT
jgi:hypothetical protein